MPRDTDHNHNIFYWMTERNFLFVLPSLGGGGEGSCIRGGEGWCGMGLDSPTPISSN